MGWMNDTLRYLAEDPINHSHHHGTATFSMMYAFSEQFLLPLSHDEVVHGKGSLWGRMHGDAWQKAANVRALLAYQWTHPGKQLIFMGDEFAQEAEWSEGRSLDWWHLDEPLHAGIRRLVTDLNAVYRAHPQLWELDAEAAGFEWIDADDAAHNVLPFLRKDRAGAPIAIAANFAGIPHEGYRLGLPEGGTWHEILNTDSALYGGSDVGNLGTVIAEDRPHGRWPHSAVLRLPPLAVIVLRPGPRP
jgi:1,4-alpha-glucan branching enzyme